MHRPLTTLLQHTPLQSSPKIHTGASALDFGLSTLHHIFSCAFQVKARLVMLLIGFLRVWRNQLHILLRICVAVGSCFVLVQFVIGNPLWSLDKTVQAVVVLDVRKRVSFVTSNAATCHTPLQKKSFHAEIYLF